MRRTHRFFVAAVLSFAVSPSVYALTINLTYDTSVSNRADFASIQTAMNFAAQQIDSAYADPTSVNVNVVADPSVGLGQSNTNLVGTLSYADTVTALTSDKTTANDTAAVASLGATDPTGGGHFWFSTAQAKALNLLPSDNVTNDGTFSFNSTATYTFDPNNRAVAGAFDFIGVAEHELTEIMGRSDLLGVTLGGGPTAVTNSYTVLDLFRYTANGTRNISSTPPSGVYFSINGGATNLHGFNSISGGDLGDWNGATNDSFNAFSSSGVADPMSAEDFTVMDAIGYDLVPEPTSLAMLGASLAAFTIRRPRKQLA